MDASTDEGERKGREAFTCLTRSASHLRGPVGDEGAPGSLSITAATNEEAVRTDHRDCHPNPHIINHLRILTILLAGQVGGQPLLRIPSIATRNAIHRVNHRRKIIPHFQTTLGWAFRGLHGASSMKSSNWPLQLFRAYFNHTNIVREITSQPEIYFLPGLSCLAFFVDEKQSSTIVFKA